MVFKKPIIAFLALLFSLPFWSNKAGAALNVNITYKTAFVKFNGKELQVGTSKVTRTWSWTGKGFVTISLVNVKTKKEWCTANNQEADWTIPERIALTEAKIVNIYAAESKDARFTSNHLQLTAEIYYPLIKTTLKYVVWAYPGSEGLRTQLYIKSDENQEGKKIAPAGLPTNEIRE